MPVLVQHFIEHKEKDDHISFIAFLHMHYAHNDLKDADYEKDMKLPFKSAENTHSTVSFHLPASNLKQDITLHFKEKKQQFPLYNFTYTSAFLSAIWQPPRTC